MKFHVDDVRLIARRARGGDSILPMRCITVANLSQMRWLMLQIRSLAPTAPLHAQMLCAKFIVCDVFCSGNVVRLFQCNAFRDRVAEPYVLVPHVCAKCGLRMRGVN